MTSQSGTAYMGVKDLQKSGIRLSLVIVDSHFIDWGTTQG